MLSKSLFYAFLFISFSVTAQYKNDNVLYKTINPDELCGTLEKNSGYLLLDVRSPGEFSDTSQYSGLNIGHLRSAKNINVRELGNRLTEISSYKNQPVFVYCSHSQRSRRASKMLADSGFTNIFNINGGMTSLYYTNASQKGCLQGLLETNNKYRIISAIDLCNKLAGKNDVYVLDVRSDSAFRHISTDVQDNAYGYIKGSFHIPLDQLSVKLKEIPKDKDIVVVDLGGIDASKAALLLKEKGFERVSFLIEGIDRLLDTDEAELACKKDWYISPVPYHIMSTKEFGRFTKANTGYLLLDVRDTASFANRHKDSFRNVGRLKNAVNIPSSEINARLNELARYKDKQIIIYGFGGDHECYNTANLLTQNGFTKLNILTNGLFDVRWTAANIKGQAYLKELVTDVPEINW